MSRYSLIQDLFSLTITSLGETLSSAVTLLPLLSEVVSNNIHVIDYSEDALHSYFLGQHSISEEFYEEFIKNARPVVDRTVFVANPVKTFAWIQEYLDTLTSSDIVLINGLDRLLGYKEKTSLISMNYSGLQTNVHFPEEENWLELAKEIDMLYEKNEDSLQGLFTTISTNQGCRNIILKTLENSNNMSIISAFSTNESEEYEEFQKKIFEKISKLTLKDALEEIEISKEKLGKKLYSYFQAMVYYNHGNIKEAIRIFESQYDTLLNENKLMLADLHIISNNKSRAIKIISELFQKDRYLKNLFPTILRIYDSSDHENHIHWLELGLKFDPNNPAIIEHNANRYNNTNQYDKASEEFRKLEKLLEKPYYELLAIISDILHDGNMKDIEINKLVYEFLALHPELKNEALFRLSVYYTKYKESYFLAYKALSDCDLDLGQPRAEDLAELKLNILIDDKKVAKALGKLKPYKNDADAKKINTERSKELINCIGILAAKNNGYLTWRNFIDECQSDSIWNTSLYDRLKDAILNINKLDINDILDKSFISRIEKVQLSENLEGDITKNPQSVVATTIAILRSIKSGELKIGTEYDSFQEASKSMMTIPEILGNNELRIWSRYYLSIIASTLGEHQEANNYALSILDYYSRVNESLKNHCLLLGLVSWGNSQYRLGRYSEGIASIIASTKFISLTNEIYPFLEEATNIIGSYLFNIIGNIPKGDFELWSDFNNNSNNKAFNHFWNIESSSSEDVIAELRDRIEKNENKDSHWAGDIVNLVAAYAGSNNLKNAVEIIKRHYVEAIESLTCRKDIRFQVLYDWSHICFVTSKTLDDYLLSLKLIELADKDLDDKRNVSHKEERASIGSSAEKIYRHYIQVCSIVFGLQEVPDFLKEIMCDKIEKILPKVTPRAINEQKGYFQSRHFSKESLELEKELKLANEEYGALFSRNYSSIDLLSKKAESIEEITKRLKEIHPHYMSLKEVESLSFSDIKSYLKDDEVFFQYVVTPLGVTTILLTSDDLKIKLKPKANIQSLVNDFSQLIQGPLYEADSDIKTIAEELSRVIINELVELIFQKRIKKVYCMPDFKIGMFPLSIATIDGKYLIDMVDSIANIIDYRVLKKNKSIYKINKVSNRIFGNLQDSELKKINKWLEKKESDSFFLLENKSDELESLDSISKVDKMNTIAIYGHGVSDPNRKLIDGSKGIEGKNCILRLGDVTDKITSMDNMILISCSGGSPSYENIESSYGTWSAIFEKFSGNIISCKWDVPTDSTIELMDELYTQSIINKVSIDESLLIAQRVMKEKYENPKYWSGIEFWIN